MPARPAMKMTRAGARAQDDLALAHVLIPVDRRLWMIVHGFGSFPRETVAR